MAHEVPVFCAKDCGGNACPLLVTIENGRAVRLRDNPASGALAPVPGTMDDYSILCALADRLGFGERFHENRDSSEWIARLLDESEIPDLETFKTSGIYIAPDQERVGLSAFAAAPTASPLSTPSGKVEIRSDSYLAEAGGSAILVWEDMPFDADYSFLLVTSKTILRTHS